MASGVRQNALVALLLVLLAAIYWVLQIYVDPPQQLTQATNDLYRYFYPHAVFMHEELRAGRIPGWNPLQLAGVPYIALLMNGPLYVPRLVALWAFDPILGMEVDFVAHVALAGLFGWLFARRIGLDTLPSLAAALGVMFARTTLEGVYRPPYIYTTVWLVASLWSLRALLDEPRPWRAFVLAACVSMMFYGGYAQGFLYGLELVAAYGLTVLLTVCPRENRGRALLFVVLAGVTALGLVAPQLLPAMEYASEASRSLDGTALKGVGKYFVLPRELKWWVWGVPLYRPMWLLLMPLVGLPLLFCGLYSRRQRVDAAFFLVAGAALLFLVCGDSGPLRGYFHFPVHSIFRLGPQRIVFVLFVVAALSTAIGLQGLGAFLRDRGVRSSRVALVLLVLTGGVVAARAADWEIEYAHPASRPEFGLEPALVDFLGRGTPAGRTLIEIGTKKVHHAAPYKSGMLHGLEILPDYEPSLPASYLEYFDLPNEPPWHGRLHVVMTMVEQKGRRPLPTHEVPPAFFDLMSVRRYALLKTSYKPFTVAKQFLEELTGGPPRPFRDFAVFTRKEALPRAYVVGRAIPVVDRAEAITRIREGRLAMRREALVEVPTDVDPGALAAVDGEGAAEIVRYEPDVVEIAARCRGECVVVLTDLFDPRWAATVDGEPAPILPTNAIFRGVRIGPGEHVVRFRYAPPLFRLGLGMLALTMLAWGGAMVLARRRS